MIFQIMAAHDKKARTYLTPFFVQNVDMGVRSFSSAVNGAPGQVITDHPEDFVLYHLGSYSDETAKLNLLPEPLVIVEAIQLKKGAR